MISVFLLAFLGTISALPNREEVMWLEPYDSGEASESFSDLQHCSGSQSQVAYQGRYGCVYSKITPLQDCC